MVPPVQLRGPQELRSVIDGLESTQNGIDIFVGCFSNKNTRLSCLGIAFADFNKAFASSIHLKIKPLAVFEPGKISSAIVDDVEQRTLHIGSLAIDNIKDDWLCPRQ